MFLKTYKSAGSTVLNILNRYADRKSLRFALPYNYHFNCPSYFHSSYVRGYNDFDKPHYDIMGHHMRFNLKEVRKIMPPDSFYFTIIRDPAKVAESSFYYSHNDFPAYQNAPNLKDFIANPDYYYQQNKNLNYLAKNPTWFDLGFIHDVPYTEDLAYDGVRIVEETFNLVLLAEYFDESMILLKEELCWELDDVVTFKLNARVNSTHLEPNEVESLRSWNDLDWYLYVYFNQTFWDKVERFGRKKMNVEVMKLRRRRQQLSKLCLGKQTPVEADKIYEKSIKPYQPMTVKINGWLVKRNLKPSVRAQCLRIVTPELQYKDLLATRQF
ncbi:hypothetical protein GDO86_019460, partial [Hymenochirus boettgeri]